MPDGTAAGRLEQVVNAAPIAILTTDADGIIDVANGAAEDLFGYKSGDLDGMLLAALLPTAPGTDDIFLRARSGGDIHDYETIGLKGDGSYVDVNVKITTLLSPSGQFVGLSAFAREISDVVDYRRQVADLAEHDALTGLPNRKRFESEIRQQIDRARRYDEFAAVLLADIDGFAELNDRYGQHLGDRALRAYAAGLISRLRNSDIAARTGGDEFAVLLPHTDAEGATIVAEQLRTWIGSGFRNDDEMSVPLTASVGLTVITADTESEDEVLALVDQAMQNERRQRD
jgi:diguanylate cyclase (GGDEF)-like protein/PAS domain S-box-containing protein